MSEAESEVQVLDASALLAWLQDEPGADEVKLEHSVINSVNFSEVLQKAKQNGVDVTGIEEELTALGLRLQNFSVEEATKAAELYRANLTGCRSVTGLA